MSVSETKYADARIGGKKLSGRWKVTKIIGEPKEPVQMAVVSREDNQNDRKIIRFRTAQGIEIEDFVDIFQCPYDPSFLAGVKERDDKEEKNG